MKDERKKTRSNSLKFFQRDYLCTTWLRHLMLSILFDVWRKMKKMVFKLEIWIYGILNCNHFLLFSGILAHFYQKCSKMFFFRKKAEFLGTNWTLGVAFAFDGCQPRPPPSLAHTQHFSIKVHINKSEYYIRSSCSMCVSGRLSFHMYSSIYSSAKNLNKNCSDFTFTHLFTLTPFKSHFVLSKRNFFLSFFAYIIMYGIEWII